MLCSRAALGAVVVEQDGFLDTAQFVEDLACGEFDAGSFDLSHRQPDQRDVRTPGVHDLGDPVDPMERDQLAQVRNPSSTAHLPGVKLWNSDQKQTSLAE